jgi:hypothetical protein
MWLQHINTITFHVATQDCYFRAFKYHKINTSDIFMTNLEMQMLSDINNKGAQEVPYL